MWLRELLYSAYERRLTARLSPEAIPRHIGILVDGNRRWAKLYGADTSAGHRAGAANVLEFLGWCDEVGVEVVTLFVPEDFLNIPTHGSIQYHPSLLPAYRGASAINWPIIKGEKETGTDKEAGEKPDDANARGEKESKQEEKNERRGVGGRRGINIPKSMDNTKPQRERPAW